MKRKRMKIYRAYISVSTNSPANKFFFEFLKEHAIAGWTAEGDHLVVYIPCGTEIGASALEHEFRSRLTAYERTITHRAKAPSMNSIPPSYMGGNSSSKSH
jgi:hypothetical protein